MKNLTIQREERFSEQELQDIRDELSYQFRKMNSYPLDADLDEVMLGVKDGLWVKQIHGPFLVEITQFVADIEAQAKRICEEVLDADTPEKLENCVKANKDLFIVNLIFNERTEGEPFNEGLRKFIFDEDARLKQ